VQNQSFNPSYKFTNKENDTESGLYYYGSRYYNAAIGKFTQIDPVVLNDVVKVLMILRVK